MHGNGEDGRANGLVGGNSGGRAARDAEAEAEQGRRRNGTEGLLGEGQRGACDRERGRANTSMCREVRSTLALCERDSWREAATAMSVAGPSAGGSGRVRPKGAYGSGSRARLSLGGKT